MAKKYEEFQSSGILLEMAKEQYKAEEERATGLDGKASFFITTIIAVATIFIPIIPFGKLLTVFTTETCSKKWISGILVAGIIIAFMLLIMAYKCLYDAYRLRDYKRPSLDCIETVGNHTARNDILNKGLCTHYKEVVDNNIETNNKKTKSIKVGISLCGIGVLVLMVSTIGLLVVIGG